MVKPIDKENYRTFSYFYKSGMSVYNTILFS